MRRLSLAAVLLCGCQSILGFEDVRSGDGIGVTASPSLVRVRVGEEESVQLQFDSPTTTALEVQLGAGPQGLQALPLTIPEGAQSADFDFSVDLTTDHGLHPVSLSMTGDGVDQNVDLEILVAGLPGSLDQSFADDGVFLGEMPATTNKAYDVAQLDNGDLIVVGTFDGQGRITRLTADGTKLWSMTTSDVVEFRGVEIDDDGSLVVVGNTSVMRLLLTGQLCRYDDQGDFATGWSGCVALGMAAADVAIEANGAITIAGSDATDATIVRRLPNGDADPGFSFATPPLAVNYTDLIVGPSEYVWATGPSLTDPATVLIDRRLSNGSQTSGLSRDGGDTGDPISDEYSGVLTIDGSGRPLAATSTNDGTFTRVALARWQSDNSEDTSFASVGLLFEYVSGTRGRATGLLTDDSDRVILQVATPSVSALIRYDEVGTKDNDFNTDGIMAGDELNAVIEVSEDRLVSVGTRGDQLLVLRFWQ